MFSNATKKRKIKKPVQACGKSICAWEGELKSYKKFVLVSLNATYMALIIWIAVVCCSRINAYSTFVLFYVAELF